MCNLYIYIFSILLGIVLYLFINIINKFSIGAENFKFHYDPDNQKWSNINDDDDSICIRKLSFIHIEGRPINYIVEDVEDLNTAIQNLNRDITNHNDTWDTAIPTVEISMLQPTAIDQSQPLDTGKSENILSESCKLSLQNKGEKRKHTESIEDDERVTALEEMGFTKDSIYTTSMHNNILDNYKKITFTQLTDKYDSSEYELYQKSSDDNKIMHDGGEENGGGIIDTDGTYWTLNPNYKVIHIYCDGGCDFDYTGNSFSYLNEGDNHFLVFDENDILIARLMVGDTLEAKNIIESINIEGKTEEEITDIINGFMHDVGNEVITAFPPGKSIVLSYKDSNVFGVFQLIKFIYPHFQFGGSPTVQASTYWNNTIETYFKNKDDILLYYNDIFMKYSEILSKFDLKTAEEAFQNNMFYLFDRSDTKSDMNKNVHIRTILMNCIISDDYTDYLNLNTSIARCMLFNYISYFLPTFRKKEIDDYKNKLLGIFRNGQLYNSKGDNKLITKQNRGYIVKQLQAFQILILIEEYDRLLEVPECESELEDIIDLLGNINDDQLEILYILYPNNHELRNYLFFQRNWKCRKNECAVKIRKGPANWVFGGSGTVFGQDDTPEDPEVTIRQRNPNCNLDRI